MYERFTDRARDVMQLANREAQRFNHEYIATEHSLLGLVRERSGVAAQVLKGLNIDLQKIRLEVEKIVQSGPDMVTMGRLPQTPRAKKVIEYAIEEAQSLHHDYVGTEHLLLGLLREDEGVASQVLMNLGLKLEGAKAQVLASLASGTRDDETPVALLTPMPWSGRALMWALFHRREIWVLLAAILGSLAGSSLGSVLIGIEGAIGGAALGSAFVGFLALCYLRCRRL